MVFSRLLVRLFPPGLEPLAGVLEDLATDLRWTWSHGGDAVWKRMDPHTWALTENPYVVLQNLTEARLKELEKDAGFRDQLLQLAEARANYCEQQGWYGKNHGDAALKGVAYLSMEYGLGKALPLYAGGLGVLAGDYLKTASDLGLPVIGIGLLYHEGYFRQVLNADGRQKQFYPYNDPTTLPIRPVHSDSGAWLHIEIGFPGRRVRFRVWQAQVGRVPLYLLDSNDPLNSPSDRGITTQLYGGGSERRLVQEIALGIGGWRLIEALGLDIDICHLNEGHAAFITLERARSHMRRTGLDFWESLWVTRPGNLFTTHTPVAAGFDLFPPELLQRYAGDYTDHLGVDLQALGALGRLNPDDPTEPFNMAYLAMRTCGAANGVSALHGRVSQRIFQPLYPHWPQKEVPVSHVTNGVHMPSWDSSWADEAWTKSCGKDRWLGTLDELACAIERLSDEALWEVRGRGRSDLVSYARQRLARHLGYHGSEPDEIAQAENVLDPNALTLGFARRFVEYKRPNLLLHDQERFLRLLTNTERPVQIIVAGKADPSDEQGKWFVQEWAQLAARTEARIHVVFLEDYDIAVAQEMVQGVDLWINTPRRPWEASGTSGMKVLVNGGLNLSVLDGWWFEAYTPEVGWALSNGKENWAPEWDHEDAEQLYRLLEDEIVPAFYDRDAAGIPRAWVARMRASMASLAPRYSSNRMVREYLERLYLPAAQSYQKRTENGGSLARELRSWELTLQNHWGSLHWGNLDIAAVDDGWQFEVQVYLGDISPDSVQVQLYADPLDDDEKPFCQVMERQVSITGATNGFLYVAKVPQLRPAADYTPRILPCHPAVSIPMEMNFICWWPGGGRQ
ncbi:alpha-glucan family phosphorylase [Pseudomonadota bacterium]